MTTFRDFVDRCRAVDPPVDPARFARWCVLGAARSELLPSEAQKPSELLAELVAYVSMREAREMVTWVCSVHGGSNRLGQIESAERVTAEAARTAEYAAPFSRWTYAARRLARKAEDMGMNLRCRRARERREERAT